FVGITIAHELGHRFGLDHVHGFICPVGAFNPDMCAKNEYGGGPDVMGGGGAGIGPGDMLSAYHAYQLHYIADPPPLPPGASIILQPLAGTTEPRAAVMTRDPEWAYWVEWRPERAAFFLYLVNQRSAELFIVGSFPEGAVYKDTGTGQTITFGSGGRVSA